MTGKGSKEKGKNYERHIADTINLVFNSKARRTPTSGAIQDRFPGDIMDLPPVLDNFTIECKKQERISMWEWLKQAAKEGEIAKKNHLLVFSRNNEIDYVVLRWDIFLDIIEQFERNKDATV